MIWQWSTCPNSLSQVFFWITQVMDEAILLRDDGLELCARVAQRREENGPPWAILAIWWFWVRAPWTYHKDHKDHKASITGSAPGWKMSSSSRSSQVFAGHPKTGGRIGTSPRFSAPTEDASCFITWRAGTRPVWGTRLSQVESYSGMNLVGHQIGLSMHFATFQNLDKTWKNCILREQKSPSWYLCHADPCGWSRLSTYLVRTDWRNLLSTFGT